MSLESLIYIRSQLNEVSQQSFGVAGVIQNIESETIKHLENLGEQVVREILLTEKSEVLSLNEIGVGQTISISIDLSGYSNYYESIKHFISVNKYSLVNEKFYIHELEYNHGVSDTNKLIENYLHLQNYLRFLESISTHTINYPNKKEFFYQKHDQVIVIDADYNKTLLNGTEIKNDLNNLVKQIEDQSDHLTRKKLFTTELINIVDTKNSKLENVIRNWNEIESNYKKSYEVYLAEFSFNKIKTSSQEYFHQLTDRIYSTIHKFSGYILAIPVAYVFIIRYFDFEGESFEKDTLLFSIGVLYFLVIWFVLLSNLSMAFEAITKDINKFMDRIKSEPSLNEIHSELNTQVTKILPKQGWKIWLVKTSSLIILGVIIFAYLRIYGADIIKIWQEWKVDNTG